MGNQARKSNSFAEEYCKMDILQPTLPVEGIHVYGVNRSGYGQTETENKEPKPKALERIEVLDELILYKSGCFERGRRWLRGQHPKLGVIAWGYTGWETVQDFDRSINPPNK